MKLRETEKKEIAELYGCIKKPEELTPTELALISIAESLIVIKNKVGRQWR